MRKIEPQRIGRNMRPFLLDMLAQYFAKSFMKKVCSRMITLSCRTFSISTSRRKIPVGSPGISLLRCTAKLVLFSYQKSGTLYRLYQQKRHYRLLVHPFRHRMAIFRKQSDKTADFFVLPFYNVGFEIHKPWDHTHEFRFSFMNLHPIACFNGSSIPARSFCFRISKSNPWMSTVIPCSRRISSVRSSGNPYVS